MRVFIGVGSNLGDRLGNIEQARSVLEKETGVRALCVSPIYETEPVGGPPQGKYLNAVWEFETELEPEKLMDVLSSVEGRLGRQRDRQGKNAPRVIDLDILAYGNEIVERSDLMIPHPRLHERWFVLKPFSDLAPDWIHPKFGRTIRDLLEEINENYPQP
ncbi:MAG: 2-amino-4-hydroxy-6-hydroxymethyldihydropteridine diphosphokinase [Candidatus Omnitrophica bacterium]|nr:2-amino-4-hydroxy-6-hydroxymethyldihydropteridine diphosphokinase [Candidatus Omnitrophota bacterium]MDD5671579.1 2-amino-4-hydroxy-6-hydroxymethyldihydropteridine diphosphokinase [Candidatus Omnitrophota bacterium]